MVACERQAVFDPGGVVVLYNETDSLVKGEAQDLVAEQGVIACARAVAEALEAAGLRVARAPFRSGIEEVLAAYSPGEWTIFNLA